MSVFYSSGNMKKIAIVIFAVAILGAVFYFSSDYFRFAPPNPLSPEEILARQEAELKKFREESLANPLTEEELREQDEELEKLREESQANPLSQEEMDRQEEELKKLRLQNN